MELTITPARLQGNITPPPSKSQAHRQIIAAALSEGTCQLRNVSFSKDILATLGCMEQLGAKWTRLTEDSLQITGIGGKTAVWDSLPHMDCGESGSTLRFLIPIALAVAGGGSFTGQGRLMERPQQPYFDLFAEKGIAYTMEDGVLTVRGQLQGGLYVLPGNVSSQFFTGLLYALPMLEGDSEIRASTPIESRSYIDMTVAALRESGVTVTETEHGYLVKGGQTYALRDGSVEADWSQAGFYYAARGLANHVEITGMNLDSCQGDRVIADYYTALCGEGEVSLDVSDCPDLVPPLAVHGALRGAGRVTRIVNGARLRIKESDRLTAVTMVLNALGAKVEELADGLVIYGAEELEGGVTIDPFNDHRIAMMTAVAATRCRKPVTVTNAACVQKSYPNFWEDYQRLGGVITEETT